MALDVQITKTSPNMCIGAGPSPGEDSEKSRGEPHVPAERAI